MYTYIYICVYCICIYNIYIFTNTVLYGHRYVFAFMNTDVSCFGSIFMYCSFNLANCNASDSPWHRQISSLYAIRLGLSI